MTHCNPNKYSFQELKSRQKKRKVEACFDGGQITSDAGALLLRELCEERGFFKSLANCFNDYRNPDLIEHSLESLLSQRILGICLGYEDLNDHDELRKDPLFALVCGEGDIKGERRLKESDKGIPLAGKSTLNRFELTPADASSEDRYKKISYNTAEIEYFINNSKQSPKSLILDLDATDIPLFGEQEGKFYHGYYDSYCYLPLYIFCDKKLLSATLRQSNIDGSFGALEEVERIVSQLREEWPDVEILLRGDSGFCRNELMEWCDENRVEYLFGLSKNKRLLDEISEAKNQCKESGEAARVFKDFRYSTLDSWDSERRVVAKAEHLINGSNPRFVVTSLESEHVGAQELYEDYYCIRGDMENRIKENQLCLFADRASAGTMRANQLRVWFSAVAYVIMEEFRSGVLTGTELETAQPDTLRKKVLKIGAKVIISARRIYISLSSAYPYKEIFEKALQKLVVPEIVSS